MTLSGVLIREKGKTAVLLGWAPVNSKNTMNLSLKIIDSPIG